MLQKKEKDATGLIVGKIGIYFLPTFIPDICYCFKNDYLY